MTNVAIQPLACDNLSKSVGMFPPIGHTTHSQQCDSGSVKTPANLPTPSSTVRNDEKDVSKPHNRKSAFTLAEGATHVANSANIRKSAFTLAEVLITLGVIGIVAALTIPNLMGAYRKCVAETELKNRNCADCVFVHI